MSPLVNNFFALLCIAVVLSAMLFRLLSIFGVSRMWAGWISAVGFAAMWWPLGAAHMPAAAYVRGISSDLSITLVVLVCLPLFRGALPRFNSREKIPVFAAVLVAAGFLYPMALGLGDWDPYRLGWGQPGMWIGLLILAFVCWLNGLRLLPALIAVSLLVWTAGLLESGNLWDYLLDPWLTLAVCAYALKALITNITERLGWRSSKASNAVRS